MPIPSQPIPAASLPSSMATRLLHRAFHAVPPTMNAPDGSPHERHFGFLNMFLKMVDAFHPDGVAVAFDKGKPRVRMEMLPQYKAHAPPWTPTCASSSP